MWGGQGSPRHRTTGVTQREMNTCQQLFQARTRRRNAFALLLAALIALPCRALEPSGAWSAFIAEDYFAAGVDVSPGNPVEGDAFIAAGRIDLSRPVGGDALLAGGRIAVSDRVGGSLYATGAGVSVDGQVAGNARLAGSRVEIGRQGRVSGRTTLVGARVLMLGASAGQLAVFGEHVTLDGAVAGDVTIAAHSLSVGPNARVAGKLTYRGALPAEVASGAMLSGGMHYLSFDFENETYQPVAYAIAWMGAIAITLGLFLIGMLAIVVAPHATARVSALARARPIGSIALGLVIVSCVPFASLLLILTVIGIPFALMLVLVWPMILMFGYLAGVMALSDAIASSNARARRIFLLALGLGVMLLFVRVPFAGWILATVLLLLGVGAIALGLIGASVPVKRGPDRRKTAGEAGSRREPTLRAD